MWFGHPYGYGYGYSMMGGWGFFGGLFMLLLIVVAVILVVGVLRQALDHRHARAQRGREALDILDQRYARGEIDGDEYKRRRADLER